MYKSTIDMSDLDEMTVLNRNYLTLIGEDLLRQLRSVNYFQLTIHQGEERQKKSRLELVRRLKVVARLEDEALTGIHPKPFDREKYVAEGLQKWEEARPKTPLIVPYQV